MRGFCVAGAEAAELTLSCLLDDAFHVRVFGGEDAGVVELVVVPQVDAVLHRGGLVWMF
jgi:hypothetical protein